jgi:hypothetical protein
MFKGNTLGNNATVTVPEQNDWSSLRLRDFGQILDVHFETERL